MAILLVVVVALALDAGAIGLICPKCGFENSPTNEFCSHCRAALSPRQADGDAADTLPGNLDGAETEEPYLPASLVETEMTLGFKYQKDGRTDIARLFFENAAALELLTDPGLKSNRPETIAQALKAYDQQQLVSRPCPVCSGTGKRLFTAGTLSGDVVRRRAGGAICKVCKGAGTVTVPESVVERKYRMARARQEYDRIQQGRKLTKIGEAWLPAGYAAQLKVREQAALIRATAAPCPVCAGAGKVDCKTCRGMGLVKCPNHDCVDGMVTATRNAKRLGTGSADRLEVCPMCRGDGFIACSTCSGSGASACPRCGGSGERERCDRCGGEGFVTCGRCQGTGSLQGKPCANCRGQGVILCATCHGDGHKP